MPTRIFYTLCLIGALVFAAALPMQSPALAAADTPTATPDAEIVYIDAGGVIRVIDPNVAAGTQEIKWNSPEGGWFDFALGDVNNDGDQEIIAIGNGKLTVFDPVVRDASITPDGLINLVPWVRLHERGAPGTPNLVGAGNMDAGVAGDEIIYGYSVNEPNNITYRLEVLKTPNGGRDWLTHINQAYGTAWKFVDVGNINNAGSEDIVLIRDADQRINAHEVDNNFNLIWQRQGSFTYQSATIAQVYAGGTGEVGIARTFGGTTESPSYLIQQFVNGNWTVPSGDIFNNNPHPDFTFHADINGNGDDELFWLRSVPESAPFVHLFMINRGGDNLPAVEVRLDTDNGYKVGDGGDVDADGREEVVIMRNNRIRNYFQLETAARDARGPRNTNLFTDYNVNTNSRSLELGNLDGEGYQAGARIQASTDVVNVTLEAGTISVGNISVQLTNIGSGGNIPISAAKETGADWFQFSLGATTTPASLFLTNFSAAKLAPGEYTERIKITSSNQSVVNQPYFITVKLTVTAASFTISPNNIAFAFASGVNAAQSRGVAVTGLPNLNFTAAIVQSPDVQAAAEALGGLPKFGYLTPQGDLILSNWKGERHTISGLAPGEVSAAAVSWPSGVPGISAASAGTVVPDTITVTVQPDSMNVDIARAMLIVIADERAGGFPGNVEFTSVLAMRNVDNQVHLPFTRK